MAYKSRVQSHFQILGLVSSEERKHWLCVTLGAALGQLTEATAGGLVLKP